MKVFQRLGPHYAIERFGIIFLSLMLAMLVLLGTILARKFEIDKATMAGQAVYTTNFAFSRTGTAGSVKGVYVSEDKTRCMLLLRVNSFSDIPTSAEEYQMMLTGSSKDMIQQSLDSHPNGMLYMFGMTGYMGVYLYTNEAFPSQIMSLTIRSLNNFSGSDGVALDGDTSFVDYDQARVYFNPGGAYATHAEFLDNPNFTVADAYKGMIADPQESQLRANLRTTLSAMHDQQVLMGEYTERLVQQGIADPDVPAEIAGDEVYAVDPNDAEMKHLNWSAIEGKWLNDSGTKKFADDATWLFLDTKNTVSGGYNFEWQTTRVSDGYLGGLTGSSDATVWNNYIEKNRAEAVTNGVIDFENVKWYYTDGREFEMTTTDENMTSAQRDAIFANIERLQAAWQQFYTLKQTYQVNQLSELLQIEANIASVANSYSVNTNSDGTSLTLY